MRNLRRTDAFVTVYEEGGFSRAAERAHATQSGLSMQVADFEATRGLRLLRHTA